MVCKIAKDESRATGAVVQRLFLLGGVLFLLLLLACFPDTSLTLLGTGLSKGVKGIKLKFFTGDGPRAFRFSTSRQGKGPGNVLGSGGRKVSGISFPGLLGILGEENESLLVSLESVNIDRDTLFTFVPAAMVVRNAYG